MIAFKLSDARHHKSSHLIWTRLLRAAYLTDYEEGLFRARDLMNGSHYCGFLLLKLPTELRQIRCQAKFTSERTDQLHDDLLHGPHQLHHLWKGVEAKRHKVIED